MANFELQKHRLEGTINTLLNAARQTQGAWEWFNALYRVVSSVRLGGAVTMYGPTQLAAGTNVIETVAVSLFGILVDNSMAAEDLYLVTSNVASTPGTTNDLGLHWVPRAAQRYLVWTEPQVFSARLEVFSVLGTTVGQKAGTASTTQPTIVLVYTK